MKCVLLCPCQLTRYLPWPLQGAGSEEDVQTAPAKLGFFRYAGSRNIFYQCVYLFFQMFQLFHILSEAF